MHIVLVGSYGIFLALIAQLIEVLDCKVNCKVC